MALRMVAPLEVGIGVRDLGKMRGFYEGVLGLAFVNEVHVPADKASQAALSDKAYTVVRLQTSHGERIKLLAAASPVTPIPPNHFILEQANAAYITFIIDDIRAACSRLRTAAVDLMTGDDPVEIRPQTWLVFFRDPEGNVVELVQYDDVDSYRPDLKRGASPGTDATKDQGAPAETPRDHPPM